MGLLVRERTSSERVDEPHSVLASRPLHLRRVVVLGLGRRRVVVEHKVIDGELQRTRSASRQRGEFARTHLLRNRAGHDGGSVDASLAVVLGCHLASVVAGGVEGGGEDEVRGRAWSRRIALPE